MKKWLLIGLGLLALFLLTSINTIPTKDEDVKAKWAQVENQYQRRADLVPNLVSTVKGYAAHESATLQAVVNARANATKVTIDPSKLDDEAAMKKFEGAQGQLSGALGRLLAVSENYPDLKANQNFLSLQSQLEGTENRISVARRDYIASVQSYNTYIRTFPGFILAGFYGAKPKANFTATTEGAEKAPEVKF